MNESRYSRTVANVRSVLLTLDVLIPIACTYTVLKLFPVPLMKIKGTGKSLSNKIYCEKKCIVNQGNECRNLKDISAQIAPEFI